ncbi:MAG TPA: protease SohB [Gammaproteobacteria bacterium]|jgi:serine protease SohB|nr:protease SohB [Gammaproteobacteria bacterium]
MTNFFFDLGLFASKALIILIVFLVILFGLLILIANAKQKPSGRLSLKNLNEKMDETKSAILAETLPKKAYKQYVKDQKKAAKAKADEAVKPAIYVLNFNGDIKASAVDTLREEITAILNVANPQDEVVLTLESGGGLVNGYGLGASQLMRLRNANIKLTVIIDKIAASGGYLMACVANQILAAPFAIIGSIGVIVQLPNFHRLLEDKHIDFEMQTAGEYKRTLTVFGKNTDAGREKLKEELEDIHAQFKQLIATHRPNIDLNKVATGEHWLGEHALSLNLIDALKTSDAYLLEKSKSATVYALCFETKKPLLAKLMGSAANAAITLYDHITRIHR